MALETAHILEDRLLAKPYAVKEMQVNVRKRSRCEERVYPVRLVPSTRELRYRSEPQ